MSFELFSAGPLTSKTPAATGSPLFATGSHTWQGHVAHVVRSDGRVLRCTIAKLVITAQHQVCVELLFRDQGKSYKKLMSPLFVACARLLWLNRDLVSEEEEQEEEEEEDLDKTAAAIANQHHIHDANQTTSSPNHRQTLPSLQLTNSMFLPPLSTDQLAQLEFVFKQTHLIMRLL